MSFANADPEPGISIADVPSAGIEIVKLENELPISSIAVADWNAPLAAKDTAAVAVDHDLPEKGLNPNFAFGSWRVTYTPDRSTFHVRCILSVAVGPAIREVRASRFSQL